jgi:pimeloyl-ACP methyl ester carboxylesterase
MRVQKLSVHGIGIQMEDHGGQGEAVVFIHHGGSNLRMWDLVVPFFSDSYRCIVLDLRGHGRSDAPASGYHIDDMATDVVGVLDELGIGKAHIVGSSIGAEVGLSAAANYPERLLSLVAEGAFHSEYGPYGTRTPESFDCDEALKLQLTERQAAPEKMYESRENLLKEKKQFYQQYGLLNPAIEATLAYGITQDAQGRFVDAWRKHASDAYTQGYFLYRFEEYYARVTCPIIILPDEDDAKDEKLADIVARLAQLPKQCEIVHVPGAMHPFGWMLNPEPMARTVLTFLGGLA